MHLMENSNRVGVLPSEEDGTRQVVPVGVVHGDESISSYRGVSVFFYYANKNDRAYEEHMTTNYLWSRS